ncbi:MAG: MarR family transcriptional regulator [Micromonosporaceae bacterium]|nr:MarR family transcriptional regulator [Micromonosporaceae bacterium]
MEPTRWLDEQEQWTWRNFLWGARLLLEALDRQLQHDSEIPHTYYMVLAALSEAPERTLAMGQLAEVVCSSPSRLSHAVARLEDAGWIRRTKRPSDRRTTLAQLTDAGLATLAAAAPGHVEAVRQHLFDRLTRDQVRVLGEAFEAIHAGLDPEHTRRLPDRDGRS